MQLLNEMNIPLKQRNVFVENFKDIPCNNLNSQTSQALINASSNSMLILSSIAIGTNCITFNIQGIISLANSMNELITFQLLNCEPTFPKNINHFLNTTSMFSLDFISNPVDMIIVSSRLYNSDWLENNLININYFGNTSIIYSLIPICLPLLLASFFVAFLNSFHSVGEIIRKLKSYIHINFLLSIYQGIFYQIFITILIGLFYDDTDISTFNFFSSITGMIFITFQFVVILGLLGLFYSYKNKIEDPDFENIFGIIYEGMEIKFPDVLLEIMFSIKLLVLLLCYFIFQSFPYIQLSLFVAIYTISFILKVKIRPYSYLKNNLQSIIREGLILLLSFQFYAYFIVIKLKSDFFTILKESLLFNLIAIISNEFIFVIVGLIQYIIDSCNEASIKSFNLSKRIKNKSFNHDLLRHRLFVSPNSIFFHNFTR